MTASMVAHVFRILAGDWYGTIDKGITVGDFVAGSDPGVVFPSWGGSGLAIAARFGIGPGGSASVSGATYPLGYANGTSSFADAASTGPDTALQTATKRFIESVENPGTFGGTFSGFSETHTLTIAIRGFNGSPAPDNGTFTVQLDDLDSQEDHNSIRTAPTVPSLFANSTDATTYAQLVLDTYADDRPIISLRFYATKSGAHRMQAIRRRVNHRITLVATNNAGLGISQDFFIENVNHKWSNGTTLWEVTWQLSPVPA